MWVVADAARDTQAARDGGAVQHLVSLVSGWDRRFVDDWLTLPPRETRAALHLAVMSGIRGGSL